MRVKQVWQVMSVLMLEIAVSIGAYFWLCDVAHTVIVYVCVVR